MDRAQAKLYTELEEDRPGTLRVLLPDVPVENYKFIKAFGRGQHVYVSCSNARWEDIDDVIFFTKSPGSYKLNPERRVYKGVELEAPVSYFEARELMNMGENIFYIPDPTAPTKVRIIKANTTPNCAIIKNASNYGMLYIYEDSARIHAGVIIDLSSI